MLLGVIASYCHGMGISDVRLLQCDTRVTVDHRVSPQELREYKIKGMGGSDMTPALRRLTDDPEVEAVILIIPRPVCGALGAHPTSHEFSTTLRSGRTARDLRLDQLPVGGQQLDLKSEGGIRRDRSSRPISVSEVRWYLE